MNQQRDELLSIGSFARAARLSIKALRLYDQLGILPPRWIDRESSYRYYHADQLHAARLIRMMRQMDMPLATIRQVLAASPADAERLVQRYWQAVEQRMIDARRMVHDLIIQLRREESMALDVNVRTLEAQPVISITKHVRVAELENTIRDSVAALYRMVEQQRVEAAGAPFGLYHGPINDDEDGPIEVCVPVSREIDGTGDVQIYRLPRVRVASVMLRGEQCAFPAVLQGYDAAYDWIQKHGYEVAGSPREVWHSAPDAEGEGELMEVAWPFHERTAS